jgi:hypothetical protein
MKEIIDAFFYIMLITCLFGFTIIITLFLLGICIQMALDIIDIFKK